MVYDTGSQDGKPFIVMECLDGQDLADVLAERRGGLPVGDAVSLVIQAADALQAAHEGGVIHRDLKPRNLFVQRNGVLKLCDFGIAWTAALTAGLTLPGTALGTACYMAPELWDGQRADERSDLYSIGCVLYELLTGLPPFTGDSLTAIMGQHMNVPPIAPREHRAGIPLGLDQLVVNLLAKDPANRPSSAAQVSAILRGIAPGTVLSTVTAPYHSGESSPTPAEQVVTPGAPEVVENTWTVEAPGDLVTGGQRAERQFIQAIAVSSDPIRVASLTGLPRVELMALSPDGSRIAVKAAKTIMLWDVTDPSQPLRTGTHVLRSTVVNEMTFSPDGNVLASSVQHEIILWPPPSRGMSRPLIASTNDVAGPIIFSAGGDLIAVSGDHSVTLWDIVGPGRKKRGYLKRVSAIPGTFPDAVAFSPSRRMLALSEMQKKQESAPGRRQSISEAFANMDPSVRGVIVPPLSSNSDDKFRIRSRAGHIVGYQQL